MCDTMVALGNSTKDGITLFAKNSDRQPNEPHLLIRVPRKNHPENTKVKCTYIEIDQVPLTYEVLLLKPSWMWGCEMGANEFGLNIGNEAVFTKEKYADDSLLGMDMMRLALERCKTAAEALELITKLLEEHGQGGNCGYNKKFTYHNAFLIADPDEAWVLETAGKFWVAQKVRDVRVISNRLSIGKDFDKSHPELIKNAVDKGWCKDEKSFDFAECYTEPVFTHFSGSKSRACIAAEELEKHKGNITAKTMMDILRRHEETVKNPFRQSSLKSVCMHGGFIFGDHTTGSYVVELREKTPTYWVTGSSTPCISVFKPYWMTDEKGIFFSEEEEKEALSYWMMRENFHRMVLENRIRRLSNYLKERGTLEKDFLEAAGALDFNNPDYGIMKSLMLDAASKEEALILKYAGDGVSGQPGIKGNPYFRYYWKKQNKALKT
jgi:dipeptidase